MRWSEVPNSDVRKWTSELKGMSDHTLSFRMRDRRTTLETFQTSQTFSILMAFWTNGANGIPIFAMCRNAGRHWGYVLKLSVPKNAPFLCLSPKCSFLKISIRCPLEGDYSLENLLIRVNHVGLFVLLIRPQIVIQNLHYRSLGDRSSPLLTDMVRNQSSLIFAFLLLYLALAFTSDQPFEVQIPKFQNVWQYLVIRFKRN